MNKHMISLWHLASFAAKTQKANKFEKRGFVLFLKRTWFGRETVSHISLSLRGIQPNMKRGASMNDSHQQSFTLFIPT